MLSIFNCLCYKILKENVFNNGVSVQIVPVHRFWQDSKMLHTFVLCNINSRVIFSFQRWTIRESEYNDEWLFGLRKIGRTGGRAYLCRLNVLSKDSWVDISTIRKNRETSFFLRTIWKSNLISIVDMGLSTVDPWGILWKKDVIKARLALILLSLDMSSVDFWKCFLPTLYMIFQEQNFTRQNFANYC